MLEGQTCSLGGSPALLMKLACADYRKGLPFPTERFATEEKTNKSALQANSCGLIEAKLILAQFHCFCYSYGSTG